MSYQPIRISELSGLYRPPDGGQPLLVLAHGAGAGHDHQHMNAIADALGEYGIGTLRFNFPFIEAGKRRVDSMPVCLETLQAAIDEASKLSPGTPLFLGGHSFGGRMATHLMTTVVPTVKGLILFSFPLHVAKKPAVTRAAHLADVTVPMLFLSGDRDALAEKALLQGVVADLAEARLHWLQTADHSFKILKRTRTNPEDVYAEAARTASEWITAF